jgi:hypothetical protein
VSYPFRNPDQTAEFGLSMAPGSGEAMAARDAWNASGRAGDALTSGNWGEAASEYGNLATAILGAIPGAGLIARGTNRGAAWMDRNLPTGVNKLLDAMTPQASKDTLYAIPAWHGSPHDFDKFELDKVGTGEGAQAFGHGLYFAGNRDVAETYQKALSPILVDGKSMNDAPFAVQQYLGTKMRGELDARIAQTEKDIAQTEQSRMRSDVLENPNTLRMVDDMLAHQRANLSLMKEVNAMDARSAGRLYRTELDVEPEDLLDWDKPLSEQSEKVRNALDAAFVARMDLPGHSKMRGSEVYYRADDNPVLASQVLKEAGIPGLRYLDNWSRGAVESPRTSNYVIFDDSLVKILGKE